MANLLRYQSHRGSCMRCACRLILQVSQPHNHTCRRLAHFCGSHPVRGLLTSYAGVADPTVHSMVVFIIIIIVSYRVWVVVARALAVVRFNEKLGISAEEVEACVEDGFCARLPAEMVKGTEAHEVKKLDLSSTAAATGPLTRTPARERTRRRASSVLAEAETIVKKQLSGDKEAHSDVGAAEAATPAPKKIENMAVFVASLFPCVATACSFANFADAPGYLQVQQSRLGAPCIADVFVWLLP